MKLPIHPSSKLAVALLASVALLGHSNVTGAYTTFGLNKSRTYGLQSILPLDTSGLNLYTKNHSNGGTQKARSKEHDSCRKEWEDRSIHYYRTVRRMDKAEAETASTSGRQKEQLQSAAKSLEKEYRKEFVTLAMTHYFALRKIKSGQLEHAERIYQKSIEQTVRSRGADGQCDHETLAASTLLLGLLKQRMGDVKGTRAVFLRFFRIVGQDEVQECRCSAKVLQAFALFEMKQGHCFKSYFLVKKAVALDGSLSPVLRWKQFRDVQQRLPRAAANYN